MRPQLIGLGVPLPEREFRFDSTRLWRFDFAWPSPEIMVALEVDGGIFTRGGHTRGSGYWKNLEKRNEATLLGWRVFNVVPIMLTLEDGRAALLLEKVFKNVHTSKSI